MKKITLILLCFLTFVSSTQAQLFKKKAKKAVPGRSIVLKGHPDEVVLKGSDSKTFYYFFFSLEEKCLFITEKKSIYDSISKFLPWVQVPGRTVEVDGPSINPFTIFVKAQLDEQSQRAGFAINRYNTFRIFNCTLVPSAEERLKEKTPAPAVEDKGDDDASAAEAEAEAAAKAKADAEAKKKKNTKSKKGEEPTRNFGG